jgi:hypothetical protein
VEELYILLNAIDKDISLNIPLDDRYDITYSADSVVHDDGYTELENEKIILTNKKEDRKVTLT